MWPSLAIALPVLLVGLAINISYALMIVFFRATYIDFGSVVLLVAMMSISGLFYIIGGQFLIGKLFHLVPISGYDTGPRRLEVPDAAGHRRRGRRHRHRHPAVPDLLLEEVNRDYVRTARAKGCASAPCCSGMCCATR
jgi:peptide/nickel transport system permease protein